MSDIFLSYARPDRERIASLAATLEAQGCSLWWDRQIEGGAEFSAVIEEQLAAAKHVVVAWSQHSLHSHWVRDEADFARTEGKLVPISLDGVLPPLGFRQMHALDFSDWRSGADKTEFIELLRAVGANGASTRTEAEVAEQAARSSVEVRQPVIQILPFANRSSDEELGYLGEGLAEDISSIFASNRHFGIATGAGEAREDYRVEGALRRMGAKARCNVKLVDPQGGTQLWADRFDAEAAELFESSDEMAGRIAARCTSEIKLYEANRAERLPPEMQGPWEAASRGWVKVFGVGFALSAVKRVIEELQRSVRAYPEFALNHAILSWAAVAVVINGMWEDDEYDMLRELVRRHLDEARRLASNDIDTLVFIGATENYSGMHERSVATLDAVLARDPYNAEAHLMISLPYAYLGRYDDGLASIGRVAELAPEAHFRNCSMWYGGLIEYLKGDYEAALAGIDYNVARNPSYGYASAVLALCHEALGDEEKARRLILQAKQTNPQLRPEKLRPMMTSQPDKEKGEREYATLERLWEEVTLSDDQA
ncbi:TIR domain-containing protein [Altererythrobacter arenosus]|uniref:TIR domain-containing protein n=1 Tax=Altererythrobacter arenosus TaxID=3032592 RepID=A0ABY8FR84_9SPHN|nr:TIR domain-containing protein [Altererythrobacter sp. CAU 1644]WFL77528.1 TIR domain-containing protein [Altererythrobacter sp. CAU 1644]